ncbi:TetR/AcrR family transcriptional regulator [Rhizobium sp. BK251]|uniref:TetR/AcrR family transcriptional regulator n=1 Tax=Rhizobium sp. BK251 TaxID=2512125 RepID=UPI0010487D0A|nr:TetR/AcrR family transcriptional regulator [Rhizobium sp. BK251]TCL75755.1 TetR family transcriptional regulator [Rhizobium sp. BK251]
MTRTRKITADDILDAAERVVVQHGAAGLSIDAVAQEAGVSKSRVVYDHKTKSALLAALVDRRIQRDMEAVKKAVEDSKDTPHPELFGRIAFAEPVPDEAEMAVAMAVCASMSSDESLQQQMRGWVARDLQAMASGARPKAALIAYLALTGLFCTELFGFHQWTGGDRREILDGIRATYATFPET